MRILLASASIVSVLALSACSPEQLVSAAADAAACTALSSTLEGLSDAYNAGLVDSGVIASIDALVGDQARELLSSSLAQDIVALGDVLAETQTAGEAQQKVDELTASISEKCSGVGVSIGG